MHSHLIRLATLSDVDTLVELMRQFHDESGVAVAVHQTARAFEVLLDDSRLGQVWVIEFDGHPAGFVVLTIVFSMEHGGLRGYVNDFFVAQPYRNRGLGHAALEEVTKACRRRGVRALVVEIKPENEAALSAYHSAGFVDSDWRVLTLPLR